MEVVSKSTLSEAMNRRDPEIFKALFEEILDRALKCAPQHKFRFHNPLYAIDSTTIDLCRSRDFAQAGLSDPEEKPGKADALVSLPSLLPSLSSK